MLPQILVDYRSKRVPSGTPVPLGESRSTCTYRYSGRVLTLKEILSKPEILDKLTRPQLKDLLDKLQHGAEAVLGHSNRKRWPGPADMAVELSKATRSPWVRAAHLNVLEDLLVDLVEGRKQRALVSTAPRHGKSELISFWFPIWLLVRDPSTKIILCSHTADLAAHFGRRIRNYIESNQEELGIHFPEVGTRRTTAAHRWELEEGGGLMTAGVGGPIVGRGAHALIIDDPIKNAEEARSEVIREKHMQWWQETAIHRLEPGGFVVIVATRWHYDDLLGRLHKLSDTGEGLPFDILNLPALAEENDPLGRIVGDPLWPERFDLAALEDIRKGMTPYGWSALFQQRPTPEEGGAIKRSWWRYHQSDPQVLHDEADVVIQSWDTAFKDLAKSDYTVGQIWARKGADFYLLDQYRARTDAPTTIQKIQEFAAKYPKARAKLIEDAANGPAIYQMIHRKTPGVILVKTKGKSKDTRLSAVAPLIEAGNVYIPEESVGHWIAEFKEELSAFPNGVNDDQCDATSQALNYLAPGGHHALLDLLKPAVEPPPATPVDLQARMFRDTIKRKMELDEKRRFTASNPDWLRQPRRTSMW